MKLTFNTHESFVLYVLYFHKWIFLLGKIINDTTYSDKASIMRFGSVENRTMKRKFVLSLPIYSYTINIIYIHSGGSGKIQHKIYTPSYQKSYRFAYKNKKIKLKQPPDIHHCRFAKIFLQSRIISRVFRHVAYTDSPVNRQGFTAP